jgi:hypothetical protein
MAKWTDDFLDPTTLFDTIGVLAADESASDDESMLDFDDLRHVNVLDLKCRAIDESCRSGTARDDAQLVHDSARHTGGGMFGALTDLCHVDIVERRELRISTENDASCGDFESSTRRQPRANGQSRFD